MDSNPIIYVALILSFIAAAIIVPVCLVSNYRNKYLRFIFNHSSALATLKAINKKYCFASFDDLKFCGEYDNENFFSDISTEDYLIYQLVYKQKIALEAINSAEQNKKLFNQYYGEVLSSCVYGKFDSPIEPLKRNTLIKFEKREFSKALQTPKTDFTITVNMYLRKMNGSLVDSKGRVFYPEQIKNIVYRLRNRSGEFYNDENIWDSICRVERGKVTNRMRFAIYARDGHRCRKCRRATKNLEIDHIFPISKGGKTVPDNLQTLCHRCNVEKSNTVQTHASIPLKMRTDKPEFCPLCSSPLLLRKGKYGNFLGCSSYPNCKYKKQL